jgi:hypothetical protein
VDFLPEVSDMETGLEFDGETSLLPETHYELNFPVLRPTGNTPKSAI